MKKVFFSLVLIALCYFNIKKTKERENMSKFNEILHSILILSIAAVVFHRLVLK